jgi:hypothetical protein
MKQHDPWAVIVSGVLKLLGFGLLLCVVAVWWLVLAGGRALRRVTKPRSAPNPRSPQVLEDIFPEDTTPPDAQH